MYQKRLIYFVVIALLLLGSVPALNIANKAWGPDRFTIPKTASELWSIDSAEGLLALTLWRCCDRSIREASVVIGKNGFLFLGNDFDQVIDKIT